MARGDRGGGVARVASKEAVARGRHQWRAHGEREGRRQTHGAEESGKEKRALTG